MTALAQTYGRSALAHASSAHVFRAQAAMPGRAAPKGRRAYRIVFRTAAVAFVAVAVAARLNPLRRARGGQRSILADARARAAATVPFIFMG